MQAAVVRAGVGVNWFRLTQGRRNRYCVSFRAKILG